MALPSNEVVIEVGGERKLKLDAKQDTLRCKNGNELPFLKDLKVEATFMDSMKPESPMFTFHVLP